MKRDIELIRIAIAAGLVALAILAGLFAVAVMADGPDFSPPELPTMTPPPPVGTPDDSTPVPPVTATPDGYPYPPPPRATQPPEPYPGWRAFVPLVEGD